MEPEASVGIRWAVARCREAFYETDIRVEAANLSIHVQLVRAGHTSAFLPGPLWRTHRMPSSLTILADEVRSMSIALRVGSDTHPAIKAVTTAIQASAAALATADPIPRNACSAGDSVATVISSMRPRLRPVARRSLTGSLASRYASPSQVNATSSVCSRRGRRGRNTLVRSVDGNQCQRHPGQSFRISLPRRRGGEFLSRP